MRDLTPSCRECFSIAAIALWAALVPVISGCSYTSSETYSGVPAASAGNAPAAQIPSSSNTESEFAGVWQGTTLASCAAFMHLPSRCDAEQKVAITLVQSANGKLTGRYTCAYGNQVCYDENTTGKVADVTIAGARLSVRVMMPDGTSCIYTGMNVNQGINGGYSCYAGGGLIEQGSWRATRSY